MAQLAGKVAIVTGAASGIGRATTEAMLDNGATTAASALPTRSGTLFTAGGRALQEPRGGGHSSVGPGHLRTTGAAGWSYPRTTSAMRAGSTASRYSCWPGR
jgi:NAD(P)-dependent dehydrogenase (short-subunit alcohol dehydrogenase family)